MHAAAGEVSDDLITLLEGAGIRDDTPGQVHREGEAAGEHAIGAERAQRGCPRGDLVVQPLETMHHALPQTLGGQFHP